MLQHGIFLNPMHPDQLLCKTKLVNKSFNVRFKFVVCTYKSSTLFESLSTSGNTGYMAKMAQFKAHLKNASNFSFLSEMKGN